MAFNLDQTSKNIIETKKKEEDSFSPELNKKTKDFIENFDKIKGDLRNLAESLIKIKIPYNKYDKDRMSTGDNSIITDASLLKESNELNSWIDKIEKDYHNSMLGMLISYSQINSKLDFINNRFQYGYLSDFSNEDKKGILRRDFPEIASQIDSLISKISELNKLFVSIDNRFKAQEKFKEMKKGFGGSDEWIPMISHINADAESMIIYNSAKVGFYGTPQELSNNLERFITEKVQKEWTHEVENNPEFNEEEKNKRKEFYNGFVVGAKEYLDELNNIIQEEKNHS